MRCTVRMKRGQRASSPSAALTSAASRDKLDSDTKMEGQSRSRISALGTTRGRLRISSSRKSKAWLEVHLALLPLQLAGREVDHEVAKTEAHALLWVS